MAIRKTIGESGFTLVEVIVSMAILTVGMVSMLSLFGMAAQIMQLGQEDLISKQKAKEAMESIYTARDDGQIIFDNIQNVGVPGGIFTAGFQPLTTAGADGLVGTADDGAVEALVLPGADGLLGTADDVVRILSNFSRQISITPIITGGIPNPDLRQLTVTIRYITPKGGQRNYAVASYISRYR